MGRLIDADEFKKQMSAMVLTSPSFFTNKVVKLLEIIDKQPTAYNVDKVVEELEALTEKHMAISEKAAELGKVYENHTILNGGKGMAYEHAIEIVRKGGVKNDNRTDD